jgi:hypothetical protein
LFFEACSGIKHKAINIDGETLQTNGFMQCRAIIAAFVSDSKAKDLILTMYAVHKPQKSLGDKKIIDVQMDQSDFFLRYHIA